MNKEDRQTIIEAYELINGLVDLCGECLDEIFKENGFVREWFTAWVNNFEEERHVPSLANCKSFCERELKTHKSE